MMLVPAFAGMAPIRAAYRHAIEQQYRFFSYGDAMLLRNRPTPDAPGHAQERTMSGLSPTPCNRLKSACISSRGRWSSHFDDGAQFTLPCEYLRVYSPSGEAGHGLGQEVLQTGSGW